MAKTQFSTNLLTSRTTRFYFQLGQYEEQQKCEKINRLNYSDYFRMLYKSPFSFIRSTLHLYVRKSISFPIPITTPTRQSTVKLPEDSEYVKVEIKSAVWMAYRQQFNNLKSLF